jgi:hypothetical protein
MLQSAKISFSKMRNSILSYGFICCALYVVFLLLMKVFNLMHVTELRMVNYVILCLVCIYQMKRWIHKTGSYIPFLQVFFTAFFTGVASFVFFTAFLFAYTRLDAELNELFIQNAPDTFRFLPSIIILFEGSAISIITALINLQYFRRYEEGEVSAKKTVRK